jgi:hypothetical protein
MPEHLKAVAVILALALPTLMLLRNPACAMAIGSLDFARRRNLWIAVTLIAFLSHNFWVFIVATGILLLNAAPRDRNRVALYFFLLFAVPQISAEITGLGVIRYFFAIDYVRLLSLVVLLPAALYLRKHQPADLTRLTPIDKVLIGYIVINLVIQLFALTFTSVMRNAFYAFIDIALPYYVVSRSLRDMRDFRDAVMSFAVAGTLVAVLGVFEFGKRWLLYNALDDALGAPWEYGDYLERGESLRAMVSTGQPIVMGYVMAVVVGAYLFLKKSVPNQAIWWLGLGVLLAGEVVPLSRGPWVGGVVMLLVFILTGPNAMSQLGKFGALGLLAVPILIITPAGERILDYLPFVGTVDEGNVTYRQILFDICIDIILANPLFGSSDFLLYMESLRQGNGIIDIVNTYLIIALNSGLVGLGFFLGFFGMIMAGILKGMRSLPKDGEEHLLGQALLGMLAGILVTIFTVSSITLVPVVYWAIAGLGFAFARLARSTAAGAAE